MKEVFLLIIVAATLANCLQENFVWRQSPFESNQAAPLAGAAESRLLGANIAAYNYLNGFIGLTVTSTRFETTSSTLTVGALATCYASGLFKAKTPCRRRRDVAAVLSALDDMKKDIEPSEVLPVTPTVNKEPMPSSPRELSSSLPDLKTSIEEDSNNEEESKGANNVALNRFRRFTAKTSTVTATQTSYFFYTTTVTSKYQTATLAAANDLLCVPGGFVLC